MKLQAKHIVVLGGTSGIGLAVAGAALAEGASITIASNASEAVDRARADLRLDQSPRSVAQTLDLRSESAIKDFFERVGPFDHLVYTAGDDLPLGPLASTDLNDARTRFDIRYWGAVAAVKYGSPLLRNEGSIVLTSGFSATRPRAGWTSQASIQAAVEGLTRALALELAPIRVNAVSRGLARTPRWDALPQTTREALYEDTVKRVPLSRVGTANEIATAYLYLMQNSYANGTIVAVDGGSALV